MVIANRLFTFIKEYLEGNSHILDVLKKHPKANPKK